MNLDINNYPYLAEAAKELDAEFPGAGCDDSLQKYQNKKELKKRIIRKIIFHGFFYSVFVIVICLLCKISAFSGMVYGLTWFLFYFAILRRTNNER
jgi:uncharacterized membrane protein YagU involved in acid resistance